MKIQAIELLPATIPLTRPYAVATHACDAVRLVGVHVVLHGGTRGLGSASPVAEVTGETFEQCHAALQAAGTWLPGHTFETAPELATLLRQKLASTPAARAAIDMALHDVWGKAHGRPTVDLLGRVHESLPTSITIGIRDLAATLEEAREYLARGFTVLKVKVGADLDLDVERLRRLRELTGAGVTLLADANLGYTLPQLVAFLQQTRDLHLQLVEQPLPPAESAAQVVLPAADVARLVADESLHDAKGAETLSRSPRCFGVWNIKLMKCGGISEALAIARIADAARVELMWGCMDESVVGIAAALHAAFACKATRHLDLDGSFDLSRDFAAGGFVLSQGRLRTVDAPGLGVSAMG